MSEIHIIAGPPGVGKSMNGEEHIDTAFDIINEDEMRFKYQQRGYPDFQQQSVFRVREMVKSRIIANKDFAYELNLGYQDQYDYVISAKTFSWENKLYVILFFTDSLQLCLDRAKERYENGLHLVKPETITKMYSNTIPLLKTNFAAIDTLKLINAEKFYQFNIVAEYNKMRKEMNVRPSGANWFQKDLRPFIEQYISEMKAEKPKSKLWTPPAQQDEDAGYDTGPER